MIFPGEGAKAQRHKSRDEEPENGQAHHSECFPPLTGPENQDCRHCNPQQGKRAESEDEGLGLGALDSLWLGHGVLSGVL